MKHNIDTDEHKCVYVCVLTKDMTLKSSLDLRENRERGRDLQSRKLSDISPLRVDAGKSLLILLTGLQSCTHVKTSEEKDNIFSLYYSL